MKYIILMLELGNEYEVFSVKFFQLFCVFEIFHDKMVGGWGRHFKIYCFRHEFKISYYPFLVIVIIKVLIWQNMNLGNKNLYTCILSNAQICNAHLFW